MQILVKGDDVRSEIKANPRHGLLQTAQLRVDGLNTVLC